MEIKVVFLSNGYGEDTISTYIIRELKKIITNNLKNLDIEKNLNVEILGFPLVDIGAKYIENDIKIIAPTKKLKSSGISGLFNLKNFIKDLKDGLIKLIQDQLKVLSDYKNKPNIYLIAVGDIYPLFVSIFKNKLSKTNVIFIPTAKSYKTEPFNPFEIYLMSLVNANFVRDELTYQKLKNKLKNVYFVGNPVLDIEYIDPLSNPNYSNLRLNNNIIVLPGRKEVCIENLSYFSKGINLLLNTLKNIEKSINQFVNPTFTVIVPNFYPIDKIQELMNQELNSEYKSRVYILEDKYYRFVLENSYLVWGQAGSGNEQAVGYKLPVIAFNENNWYRKRQKKLLNNCLILIKRYDIQELINETINLFIDKDRYRFIQEECIKEMGALGGAQKIANYIYNLLKDNLVSKV